jgi:hypothetical protein
MARGAPQSDRPRQHKSSTHHLRAAEEKTLSHQNQSPPGSRAIPAANAKVVNIRNLAPGPGTYNPPISSVVADAKDVKIPEGRNPQAVEGSFEAAVRDYIRERCSSINEMRFEFCVRTQTDNVYLAILIQSFKSQIKYFSRSRKQPQILHLVRTIRNCCRMGAEPSSTNKCICRGGEIFI